MINEERERESKQQKSSFRDTDGLFCHQKTRGIGTTPTNISSQFKKQQFSEAFSGANIREGAGELTVRAEEVRMQRAFINTKHIELERWGPPPVDADWHAFCQTIHKGIEGEEWEEHKTRLELWEEHMKDTVAALAKALESLENPFEEWHLVSQFVVASLSRRNGSQHRWCKDFAKDVGRTLLGRGLAVSGFVGCCGFAHNV